MAPTPAPGMLNLIVVSAIGGLLGGIALKILWDWIYLGRVKKEAPYVLLKDCEGHRERCCISKTKREVSELTVRVSSAEKRLDEGREDFKGLRKDIGEVKEDISGMKSILEQVRKFVMKEIG